MDKVQQIGYYAKDSEGNLHQFQWEQDNTFGILNIATKEYVPSNVDDYEILEIGYFHNENQPTNTMDIADYTTTMRTLKAMLRDKEQQIKDDPKASWWTNENRKFINAIDLVEMELQKPFTN